MLTNPFEDAFRECFNEHDLAILNDGSPTFLSFTIDLSVCHLALIAEYAWKVLDDLYGSDHFPISLHSTIIHNTSTVCD